MVLLSKVRFISNISDPGILYVDYTNKDRRHFDSLVEITISARVNVDCLIVYLNGKESAYADVANVGGLLNVRSETLNKTTLKFNIAKEEIVENIKKIHIEIKFNKTKEARQALVEFGCFLKSNAEVNKNAIKSITSQKNIKYNINDNDIDIKAGETIKPEAIIARVSYATKRIVLKGANVNGKILVPKIIDLNHSPYDEDNSRLVSVNYCLTNIGFESSSLMLVMIIFNEKRVMI